MVSAPSWSGILSRGTRHGDGGDRGWQQDHALLRVLRSSIALVRIASAVSGRTRYYTDDIGRFYNGRLFLCSEQCCASIIKGFGTVDAFQEWVRASPCPVSVASCPGEE